jgi:ATP/ADP translocase
VVLGVVESLQLYLRRFSGLWYKFLPMLSLFFCLSFINTILDSLKDTLVITAAGGGAHVIPYLTVYAVLPISFMFLVAYSYASRHLSRAGLFNTIVAAFMVFFGAFTLLLYPNAEALHPHAFADSLSQVRQQQQPLKWGGPDQSQWDRAGQWDSWGPEAAGATGRAGRGRAGQGRAEKWE